MMTGKIKKIMPKGFGFIASEGMAKDVFFHSNSVVGTAFDSLQEGMDVTFDTEDSPKGMNAINVQVVQH